MGGHRVKCRTCGAVAELPGNGEELEDDCDSSPTPSKRRRKKKKSSNWQAGEVGVLLLRVCGFVSAAHGALALLVSLPVLLLVAVSRNLLLGVIAMVYAFLVWMGMKGAVGRGIAVSRETQLKGTSGIIVGILLVEVTTWGTMYALNAVFNPKGIKPIVTFNLEPPPPVATSVASSVASSAGNPTTSSLAPSAPGANAPPGRRHNDTTRGFSIVPPAGWEMKLENGIKIQAFVGPDLNNYRSNMVFALEGIPGALDTAVARKIAQFRKEAPDLQILSQSEFLLADGSRGMKLETNVFLQQRQVRFNAYLFDRPPNKLVIVTGTPVETAADVGESMEASVRTIQFDGVQPGVQSGVKTPQMSFDLQPRKDATSTSQTLQVFTKVTGFTGNGDILEAARGAAFGSSNRSKSDSVRCLFGHIEYGCCDTCFHTTHQGSSYERGVSNSGNLDADLHEMNLFRLQMRLAVLRGGYSPKNHSFEAARGLGLGGVKWNV